MLATLETLTTVNNFRIPANTTVIDFEHDTVSMYKPNDTRIERLTLEVNGHPVQIIRYDGDNRGVAVGIDGLPGSAVDDYIYRRAGANV